MEANLVVFETSGNRCDVALLSQSAQGVRAWTQSHDGSAEHAQHVLPILDALLRQAGMARADISAVAFGQGPGGFTGLRVACGLAQGLAFALDVPVIPVSSLLVLAEQDRLAAVAAVEDEQVWAVLQDARMGEVYAAIYHWEAGAQHWRVLHAPCLMDAADAGHWLRDSLAQHADARQLPLRVVGDALRAFPDLAASLPAHQAGAGDLPQARALGQLALRAWQAGESVPPEQAAPLYVRDKVAYTTQEREQGLGGNPKARLPVPPPLPLAVVPMTEAHLAQVVEIERLGQAFPWTQGNFSDALQAGYGAWVACRADVVEGFCLVMFAPDIAHLLLISVHPDHRRHGVGKRLMHFAQEQVRRRELPALILEVRPSNDGARDFYARLGFQELSVRKGYYPDGQNGREDALVLWKSFEAPVLPHDAAVSGQSPGEAVR